MEEQTKHGGKGFTEPILVRREPRWDVSVHREPRWLIFEPYREPKEPSWHCEPASFENLTPGVKSQLDF